MGLAQRAGRIAWAGPLVAALLLGGALLGSGCARKPAVAADPAPEAAQAARRADAFFDSAGTALDETGLRERLAAARYVLVGEAHPSACDHQAQARILQAMAQAGRAPAVGLEMVGLDRQPVLDLFNAGRLGVDDLARDLDWERLWGFDFEAYRPVFETAARLGLPLYALNAPNGVASRYGRVGLSGLSAGERHGLPAKILPAPGAQAAFLREVFDSHGGGSGKGPTNWKRFVRVQSFWDTVMAHRAVLAARDSGRPVAILAGGGHVDAGWGVASRLETLDPEGGRLLVSAWRSGPAPDPAQADVFFFCPQPHQGRLGLSLEPAEGGLAVRAVEPGSPAQAAGVQPGDVLVAAWGKPLATVRDLRLAAAKAFGDGVALPLDLVRDGAGVSLAISLAAPNP